MKKVIIELLVTGDNQHRAVDEFCTLLNGHAVNTTNEAIPYMLADLSELEGQIVTAKITEEHYDFTQKYEKFVDNTKKS